jgi:hypothetical protein
MIIGGYQDTNTNRRAWFQLARLPCQLRLAAARTAQPLHYRLQQCVPSGEYRERQIPHFRAQSDRIRRLRTRKMLSRIEEGAQVGLILFGEALRLLLEKIVGKTLELRTRGTDQPIESAVDLIPDRSTAEHAGRRHDDLGARAFAP